MRVLKQLIKFAIPAALALIISTPSNAEVDKVVLAKQWGLGSLSLIVMEHQKLYQKALASAGLDHPVEVQWVKLNGGAAVNDAVLSGNLNFAMAGVPPLLTLWDKTRTNIRVMAVCAVNAMPMILNTRNPKVKTVEDFTSKDRIALPGVKVSAQALLLQMAAAKTFGDTHYTKLDPLTVTLSHADGMAELFSKRSTVDSHFTSPPYSYLELEKPGIHTVLNSYKMLGGPANQNLIYTTTKFREENPKIYGAFLKAFQEATDFVNTHREQAADIYLQVTNDKLLTKKKLVEMLSNPEIRYTMVPERTMEVAKFMHKIGRIKAEPKSWHDLFFPNIWNLPGS